VQGRDSRLGLLAHTTLKALEQQLAEASLAVVRIHRTTIVNQAYAREVRPDRKSDFAISLADGTVLRGSRRYSRTSRQRLAARAALPGPRPSSREFAVAAVIS
jgi:DNA-binding LytR/AlgR family response regulator